MPAAPRRTPQPFKEHVGTASVALLADAVASAVDGFDRAAFVHEATAGLDALELKPRVHHVAAALGRHLRAEPAVGQAVVDAVLAAPGAALWELWPVVEWAGSAFAGDPATAYALLARLTARSTAEWAVRPLYDADPALAATQLAAWAASDDEHLRRLASESTRPRLPWAPRSRTVDADPAWALPVLDALHEDPSPYVRRSVANHLNDLTRVAPELAMATARRWLAGGGPHAAEVVRHGLRSRVKAGDPEALALLGVAVDAVVHVEHLDVRTPQVQLGDAVHFAVALRLDVAAPEPVDAVVDYGISYARPGRAEPAGRKVFKLRRLRLEPGVPHLVERRHPLVPVTIRRYHAGVHRVDVQVNGRILAVAAFRLEVPPGEG